MRDTLKNVGTPELEWLFKSAADSGVTLPDLIASIICDAYDDEHPEPVEAGAIDETIFPVGRFRGQWNEGDPPLWEVFDVCLFGNEAGDFIVCADKMHETLQASGYKLTLEKINPTTGEKP
jgi:hypothetical protein